MTGIEDQHWVLWAVRCRGVAGSELGYPRQQPWYTPPRRPDDESDADREVLPRMTPHDELLADQIGIAVNALEKIRRQQAMALRAWWGAYPRPAKTVEHRARAVGVPRQYVYEVRDEARRWCEALIELRMARCC